MGRKAEVLSRVGARERLVITKNKIYGPKNCVFCPPEVNNFLLANNVDRGLYKVGVQPSTSGRYRASARLSSNQGKIASLGSYDTEKQAHQVYCKAKELDAKKLAAEYKDQIDSRLYKAMINYTVAAYVD